MIRILGIVFALFVLLSQPAPAACVGMTLESSPPAAAGDTCASDQISIPEGRGKTFRVGPGQDYNDIGDVPWAELAAGDTVYIHHRAEPYRAKILISARGTSKQWVRILGVPGADGSLPVVSGDEAVTSRNARFRWNKPDLIEWLGVVQIAVGADGDGSRAQPPAYIEIANLQVQDGFKDFRFQASNGSWLNYNGFAACIYARSVDHLVVRNTVLTNCGQGFYNWTGDGASPDWWSALQRKTVLSGNYFYNNGNPGSYLEHQAYTESDGVTIEYNRFGPQRNGARGSQIKDRSIGTVIRYNTIAQSREGWSLDLVEPEESYSVLGDKPEFKQTFVYGNLIVSRGVPDPNIVHWNEDHQSGHGRAAVPDGTLYYYHNTLIIFSDRSDPRPYTIFNGTWGGYDCPSGDSPGVIDLRNNIFSTISTAAGDRTPPIKLGYCGSENIALGKNWISPGAIPTGVLSGWSNLISPADNDAGFLSNHDFRLENGSSAMAVAGELASATATNSLGVSLIPVLRHINESRLGERSAHGPWNLGAY